MRIERNLGVFIQDVNQLEGPTIGSPYRYRTLRTLCCPSGTIVAHRLETRPAKPDSYEVLRSGA